MKRKISIPLMVLISAMIFLFVTAQQAAADDIGENILLNASFDQLESGTPDPWAANDHWHSGAVLSSPEAARTGDNGILMKSESTANYWVRQTINVEEGQIYELSAWVTSQVANQGKVEMKIEFYQDTTDLAGYLGGISSEEFGSYDEWENINMYAEMPKNTNIAQVYLRLYGPGTVTYDDISFHQIEHVPGISLFTDRIFYYEDLEQGRVSGKVRPGDGIYEDKRIDIQISSAHDDTTIVQETIIPESEDLHFIFDPMLMNLQEPYTVEVTLRSDQDGVLFQEETQIYRWERPTALREDGTLLVDGEPIFPLIGYRVPEENYSQAKEVVNILTTVGLNRGEKHEVIQAKLDKIHEHGLKMFFTLNPDFGDLNGPLGFEYVEDMVETYKGHPAVVGWLLVDEPDGKGLPISDLAELYRITRTLDPVHPTYMVVAMAAQYEMYGRTTDILVADPYPLPNTPITFVGEQVQIGAQLYPERPTWSILQAFTWPPNYEYTPNITEVRHMAYQSLLAGAKGLGYYAFTTPTGWELMKEELYEGIVDFANHEVPHLSEFILNGESLDRYKDENVQWGIWESEDQWYTVAINLTEQSQTVSIPLPHDGYDAEVIAPKHSQFHIYRPELNLELSALESALVKLTLPPSSAAMKEWVEEFDRQGEFKNNEIVRSLNMHLTSVEHFEKQDENEKVMRHMYGFKQLIHHQYENELMSEKAYHLLDREADALIDRIIESFLHVNVRISDANGIAGEDLRVNVQLTNRGDVPLEGLKVGLELADEFGSVSGSDEVPTLLPGETVELSYDVEIPNHISSQTYPILAHIQFDYYGMEANYRQSIHINVISAVETLRHTNSIQAARSGNFPMSINLINHSSKSIDIFLESDIQEHITLEWGAPIQIEAGEVLEIEGNVIIANGAPEGEYRISSNVIVDGVTVDILETVVSLDRNLVENSGFEKLTNGTPESWWALGHWGLDAITTTTEESHEGNQSLKISTQSSANYYALQLIDVEEGATYDFSAWVKSQLEEAGHVEMKVEFYRDQTGPQGWKGQVVRDPIGNLENWEQMNMKVNVPADANLARIFVRLYGPGTVYFDDVAFKFAE